MAGATPLFRFLLKHPAFTAAAGGGALAVGSLQDRADQLEAEIMRNRLGAPQGKFVYAELAEFSSRKKFLSEKTAFIKAAQGDTDYDTSQDFNPQQLLGGSFLRGVGGETARQIIEGTGRGVGRSARKIKDKLVLEPQRQRILEEVITEDPVVSVYEKESPGAAARAYASMRRFAPELSTDPNVVAAYLREAAQTGGAANYMTIKQLAETEAAINKAQGRNV